VSQELVAANYTGAGRQAESTHQQQTISGTFIANTGRGSNITDLFAVISIGNKSPSHSLRAANPEVGFSSLDALEVLENGFLRKLLDQS
jgi:hypothetical protein